MKKRSLLLLAICLALLLLCLAACGKATPSGTPTTVTDEKRSELPTEDSATETEEPIDPSLRYDVPSDLRFPNDEDGNPQKVHVLQRKDQAGVTNEMEVKKDLENPTKVQSAIYSRQEYIMEKLNVEFDYQYESGAATNADKAGFQQRMRNINSSGVTDPWIVSSMIYFLPPLMAEDTNILYDLYTLNPNRTNYMDFDKVWWNSSVKEQVELNGKLYFAVSEANISVYNRMTVMLVNLTLADELLKDSNGNAYDFRQMVYDGKWDMTTFLSMLRQVGNGDLENPNSSYWGLTVRNDATTIDGFLLASGVRITQRDSDGKPTADGVFNTEWNKDRNEKIKALYNSNGAVLKGAKAVDVENPFVQGKAVFHANLMLAVAQENIRGMSDSFALLPLPKYSEVQDDYRVSSHNEFNALAILNCTKNTDIASAVLEMMSYESYQNVRPALFEDTYALRSLQTLENRTMFYYILDHSYIDFAQVFGDIFGLPLDYMREAVRYNKSVVDTFDARNEKTVTRLETFVKKLWGEE